MKIHLKLLLSQILMTWLHGNCWEIWMDCPPQLSNQKYTEVYSDFSTCKVKAECHILYLHCANKGAQTDSMKANFGNRSRMEHSFNTARWPVHALGDCRLQQESQFRCTFILGLHFLMHFHLSPSHTLAKIWKPKNFVLSSHNSFILPCRKNPNQSSGQ